ncbi:hypothetical protein V8E51_012864 [Hyaloscypha variabilis]
MADQQAETNKEIHKGRAPIPNGGVGPFWFICNLGARDAEGQEWIMKRFIEHIPKAIAAGATSMTVHKACQGFKVVVQEKYDGSDAGEKYLRVHDHEGMADAHEIILKLDLDRS